jgi:hypothetical protein
MFVSVSSAPSPSLVVLRLSSWILWLLKMGPLCCPETSVRSYYYALWNIPEECRSYPHCILGECTCTFIVVLFVKGVMIASKDEVTDPLSLFEHAPDSAGYSAEFLPLKGCEKGCRFNTIIQFIQSFNASFCLVEMIMLRRFSCTFPCQSSLTVQR